MQAFTRLDAKIAPLPLANIDTDQIIPKQFLKTVEREGLAKGLFYDLRFDEQGKEKPDFVLNRPEYKGAGVLVTGDNFGCGSSREHAPWALMDFGVRCVISTSFADIFYSNCTKVGLLPVVLAEEEVRAVMAEGEAAIDLEVQEVEFAGRVARFEIDPEIKYRLMNGLDDIGITLERAADIDAYERDRERASVPTTAL